MKQRSRSIFVACWLSAVVACSLSWSVHATPRPFDADSLHAIERARDGQPFMLVLWSLDCPPCLTELATLGRTANQLSDQRLVLISTDTTADDAEIDALMKRVGLTRFEHWRFADGFVERLRYAVDADWYGELPRVYLYPPDHARVSYSGILDDVTLGQWLRQLVSDTRAQE